MALLTALYTAILLGLAQQALGESVDGLGAGAPGLETKAPEPTTFQLGDHGVAEQTGAATYTVEIEVPPGRHGIQPKLSLNYSSRAPLRGGIAAGWSLDLPSIQRDPSFGTLDETVYTASLGGASGRLVQVPDVSALGGIPYRLEQDDSFTRFERVAYTVSYDVSSALTSPLNADSLAYLANYQTESSPSGSVTFDPGLLGGGELVAADTAIRWVAWTSDGVRHYFGSTPGAGDGRARWLLDRQVDRHGNTVTFLWDAVKDDAGRVVDHQIRRIEYTSNAPAGLGAHARVDFEYAPGLETCPGSEAPIGASLDMSSGSLRYLGARRLEAVVTRARDVPGGAFREVKRVTLGYDEDALNCDGIEAPLRLLTRIDREGFAPDGSSTPLRPLTFGYGSSERTFSETRSVSASPVHWGTDRELQGMLLEIDGDGIPDRVEMRTGTRYCELLWHSGQPGGGWSESSQVIELRDATLPWTNGVGPTRGGNGGPERCTLMGQTTYRSNKDDAPLSCTAGNFNAYHFADVDGDGRTDLLSSLSVDPYLYDPYADPLMNEHNPYSAQNPPPSGGGGGGLLTDVTKVDSSRLGDSMLFAISPTATLDPAPTASEPIATSGTLDAVDPAPSDDPPLTTYAINLGDVSLVGDGLWARIDYNPQPPPPPPCNPAKLEPIPYVWRVYRNTGSAFVKTKRYPSQVPVELPGTGNEGSPLRRSIQSSDGNALVDMDGDGRLDAVRNWTVYPGDGQGNFGPARAWPLPQGVTVPVSGSGGDLSATEAAIHGGRRSWGTSGLGDINGDGLPDLLVSKGDGLLAYLNHGRGFLSSPTDLGVDHYLHMWRRATFYGGTGRYDYYRTDVNGDGLADLLELRRPESDPYPDVATPRVYPNVGDRFLTPPRPLPQVWKRAERYLMLRGLEDHERVNSASSAWFFETDLMDANGDGRADLVAWSGDNLLIRSDPADATPAHLLEWVDNGVGALTRYHYVPSSDPATVTRGASDEALPHVHQVVDAITIEDRFGTPSTTTRYRYADPVYAAQSGDPLDPRRFLGFRRVTRSHPIGARVEQRYDYDGAGDRRGRLVRETTFDGNTPRTLRSRTWHQEPLFGGLTVFTHWGTELERTCSSDLESCMLQRGDLERVHESWEPWAHPDSGEVSLYLRSRVEHGRTVGEVYREQTLSHDVCYADDCFQVLLTASEAREDGYGVLRRLETEYEQGLPVREHRFIDASTAATTQHTFDFRTGNRHTTTKPEQLAHGGAAHRSFVYDSHQLHVAETTNELGHVVETEYDVGTGALVQQTGPNPQQQEVRTLDGLGRVIERAVLLDEGAGPVLAPVERIEYVDLSLPRRLLTQKLVDAATDTWTPTDRVFDGVGRIRSEDVLGAVTFYDYDLEGNLTAIHVTDPTTDSGDTVAYTYERDALGRLVRFARPDGTSIDVRYSGLRKEVEETSGDGSGGLRILDYDSFERIVRLEEIGGESGPAIWEYDYDALGSLVGLLDADGHYTEIEYDWTSRRRRISRGARSWFYDYDLNGNLLAETSPFPDGSSAAAYTTTFAYDALDRVLQRTPAPRELSATRQAELGSGPIDFYYDGEAGPAANAIGRLSHVALPFGYVSYGYTPRGMASYEERFFAVGAAVASQWVSRSFNALGRVTRVEHDDGTVARTSYDGRGQVDRVEWYDRRAREWKAAADFERSLAGQVRVRESDFRQHRVFEYDSLGRPIRDDIRGGSRMPLRAWREYDYSGSGELIAVRGQNLDLDASAAYEYDGLRRLVSANGPRGYAGEFRYSPAGNVLAARVDWLDSLESRDVTYDYGDVDPQAVDRLVDRATGFVHASFGYDLAGNVVSRETADASFSFTWDGDDQLREAATAEGAEVYYYDHAGSRMLAVDPARGVRFWFGASETRFGSSGAQKQRWIHVGAGGVTLARVENGRSIELQYSDSLQNLLLTLDRAGRPRASFLYGPFGEVLSEEDGEGHRRRFNGKEHDAFTGLRYYGFRYYDALALRWNGADPLYRFRPEAGLRDPQRTNLYAFSLNNPVRYLDPDGRDVVIVWGNDPKLKGKYYTKQVADQLKADLKGTGIKVHVVKHNNNERRKQLKKSGKVTTLAFSGHGAPRGQVDPSGHCADGGNCNSPNTTLDDFADAWGLQDDGAMILLSCLSVSGDSEPEQNLAERGIEVAGFSGLLSWNINGKMAEGNYEGRGKELQEKGVTPGNLVVDQQSTKKEDEAKDNVTKIIKRTETKQ